MSSESRDVESQNFSETGPHFKISHRAPDFTGPALQRREPEAGGFWLFRRGEERRESTGTRSGRRRTFAEACDLGTRDHNDWAAWAVAEAAEERV
jgi:hypothetical protein